MDIVFDFDGVLCEYQGWRGHDDIGEPILEMVDLVSDLFDEGHKLKLCTTRLNPYPKGDLWEDEVVSSGKAKEIIMKWLEENKILHCFKVISGYKPFGDVYIDDRAIRFGDVKGEDIIELEKKVVDVSNDFKCFIHKKQEANHG